MLFLDSCNCHHNFILTSLRFFAAIFKYSSLYRQANFSFVLNYSNLFPAYLQIQLKCALKTSNTFQFNLHIANYSPKLSQPFPFFMLAGKRATGEHFTTCFLKTWHQNFDTESWQLLFADLKTAL